MTNATRVSFRERRLNRGKVREDDDRAKRRDNPGPWAEDIVRKIEEERTAEGVLLGFRRQHALCNIRTTARLSARIPIRPPANRHRKNEDHQSEL